MSSPKESHRFAVLGILALDQLNKENKQTDVGRDKNVKEILTCLIVN